VRRLERVVPHLLAGAVEFVDRLGSLQALDRLADAELIGVLGGVDDEEAARRHQPQHVALFGEAQRARQHLAHAAGGAQIRLIAANGADRNDGLEALVEGAGVHALIAAARGAGDAEFVSIDLGARDQVIDGAAIVVNLQSQQRVPGRPKGAAEQGAVIAGAGGMALAGAEGIDGQDEEAEMHQAQTARLHHGVAAAPAQWP